MENITEHRLTIPDHLAPAACDLITCLLQPLPQDRLGFDDMDKLKEHAFFEGVQFGHSKHSAWTCQRSASWCLSVPLLVPLVICACSQLLLAGR